MGVVCGLGVGGLGRGGATEVARRRKQRQAGGGLPVGAVAGRSSTGQRREALWRALPLARA
eukprot:COSAG03_NODE_21246_length_307_cov_0.495192_1_plen_60_part_10